MLVYKQYSQELLDAGFNNRLHVPHFAGYLNKWELLSRQTEQTIPVVKDLQYGSLQREMLDIFPSASPESKTLIFGHGGYWQMLDKSLFHFISGSFHAYGITTVLVNYPLAPQASIDQIVFSCRKAISWLFGNASVYNIDPHQMYVTGHSAGGHLAAMLMSTDWKHFNPDLSANVFKGICTVSGLFDLVPVQLSYFNKVLMMDVETAARNSPVRIEPLNACPIIVAVGEDETEQFNNQSSEFYAYCKDKGTDIELIRLQGQNHYSIVETIVDPHSSLHHALLGLMKIK